MEESDHSGAHEATYRVSHHDDMAVDVTKTRQLHMDGATHDYTKKMHISSQGVVETVIVNEAFSHTEASMRHDSLPGRQDAKRTSGGEEVEVDMSDAFEGPELAPAHSFATTSIRLLDRHVAPTEQPLAADVTDLPHELHFDDLSDPGIVTPPTLRHAQIREELDEYIACMVADRLANATSVRTDDCFYNATKLSASMSPQGTEEWCSIEFGALAVAVDADAALERIRVLIDVLVSVQTAEAQRCLVSNILQAESPVMELVIRTVEAIARIREPCMELVAVVSALAHKHSQQEFPEAMRSDELQHRALLMVGSMAGRIHNQSQPELAAALLEPIERELGLFEASKASRYRREADGVTLKRPTEQDKATHLRVSVLLEALGNAGLPSSSPHIISHAVEENLPVGIRESDRKSVV